MPPNMHRPNKTTEKILNDFQLILPFTIQFQFQTSRPKNLYSSVFVLLCLYRSKDWQQINQAHVHPEEFLRLKNRHPNGNRIRNLGAWATFDRMTLQPVYSLQSPAPPSEVCSSTPVRQTDWAHIPGTESTSTQNCISWIRVVLTKHSEKW